MNTTELQVVGPVGLAAAWGTLAAPLGALIVGLVVGTAYRVRAVGRQRAAIAEGERERASLQRVAGELARTPDVEGVARALLDEIGSLFGVGFAALTFVSDDAREATGYLARSNRRDLDWWRELHIDLTLEPSGIASAVYEASGFAVYDASSSNRVSPRLVEEVGAKSAAFVPLVNEDRVIAVISIAATDDHRAFSSEDLAVMQAMASEAAIALERTRSALALADAVERER